MVNFQIIVLMTVEEFQQANQYKCIVSEMIKKKKKKKLCISIFGENNFFFPIFFFTIKSDFVLTKCCMSICKDVQVTELCNLLDL